MLAGEAADRHRVLVAHLAAGAPRRRPRRQGRREVGGGGALHGRWGARGLGGPRIGGEGALPHLRGTHRHPGGTGQRPGARQSCRARHRALRRRHRPGERVLGRVPAPGPRIPARDSLGVEGGEDVGGLCEQQPARILQVPLGRWGAREQPLVLVLHLSAGQQGPRVVLCMPAGSVVGRGGVGRRDPPRHVLRVAIEARVARHDKWLARGVVQDARLPGLEGAGARGAAVPLARGGAVEGGRVGGRFGGDGSLVVDAGAAPKNHQADAEEPGGADSQDDEDDEDGDGDDELGEHDVV
mmetsp:Transcript_13867/g.35413  ORF Transcript_13867/g.35413 Transcript_13867/m.35413 type:complete len:297 (+) Transcript_13867:199-1089(+)